MNPKNLTSYKPYSISPNRDPNYADIVFENEGLMTIPKSSATTIVKLLNDAFQNGVKMTLKNVSSSETINLNSQEFYKPNKIVQEEPVPINSFKKKNK